jgi:uncharacterized protein (TIGR03435 family)
MTRLALLVGLAVAAVPLLAGQRSDAPRFEVVSIKPVPPETQGGGLQIAPGGRVTWRNVTLSAMVNAAYQRFQWDSREIVGGPDWFNETHFDVVALAPGGLPKADADGFPSQLLAMFRRVLEDRFRLVTHSKPRERPVYNLVLDHADRRLGPKLVPAAVDCAKVADATFAGTPPPPRPGRDRECNFSRTTEAEAGSLQGNAVTITVLARFLAGEGLGREVVDRTGLSGTFDVDLLYLPEFPVGGVSPDRLALDPRFQGRPGLTTALREQLGLKLEPSRAPVEVLVIDSVERPTPD